MGRIIFGETVEGLSPGTYSAQLTIVDSSGREIGKGPMTAVEVPAPPANPVFDPVEIEGKA